MSSKGITWAIIVAFSVGTLVAQATRAQSKGAATTALVIKGVQAFQQQNYPEALRLWRIAANAGDPDAQFNLGQAYKLGRGVAVDLATAESWYRKSALQGQPNAQDNYGLALFQDGRHAEALPWLEKSVARGEPRVQFVLSTMLFNGDGVERDWVRAYALMGLSSNAGLPQASQALAEMDKYVPEDMRQKGLALARQYETKAAHGGQADTTASSGAMTPVRRP